MDRPRDNRMVASGERIVGGAVGFAFAGIGATVLISLWTWSPYVFAAPPLFFRLVGSFIAIVFVLMGSSLVFRALAGEAPPATGAAVTTADDGAGRRSMGRYVCPQCGAPLGRGVDVSPSGDVKCSYCNTWFNVHRTPTSE